MKILHTADWHIGKSLYKHDLYDDLDLFFNELVDIIKKEHIDVLLVSGDIFDLANPSNKDKEIYFHFLAQLIQLKIKVIITAGNHDSVRMLEAPAALLKQLDIHIIGDGRSIESQIIPLEKAGHVEAVVLAIPYLRDRDVRKVGVAESYEHKKKALREGIVEHYEKVRAFAQKSYKGKPVIAMGHLYMQGASVSESERDIQLGNEAGISVKNFESKADYFALGHIHRPQSLNEEGTVRYSGSPIALSFSERKDNKQVVVLRIEDSRIKAIESHPLTKFRVLKRITGTVNEIRSSLETFENKGVLPAYLELLAEEDKRDARKTMEFVEMSNIKSEQFKIVSNKIGFSDKLTGMSGFRSNTMIEDLQPIEVFRSRIAERVKDEETAKNLEVAFNKLLDDLGLQE